MTYANPIFTYGSEKFLKRCGETGIDALIVPIFLLRKRKNWLLSAKNMMSDLSQ